MPQLSQGLILFVTVVGMVLGVATGIFLVKRGEILASLFAMGGVFALIATQIFLPDGPISQLVFDFGFAFNAAMLFIWWAGTKRR